VQYMLLIYDNEKALAGMPEDERRALMGEYFAYTEGLQKAGAFVEGAPLESTSTATTVRVRDGETLTTDGPFAETREQLGGYFLIDAKDLDEAIGIAARIPVARVGTVEIRPVMEITGVPTD
jgi:hypothetical protein